MKAKNTNMFFCEDQISHTFWNIKLLPYSSLLEIHSIIRKERGISYLLFKSGRNLMPMSRCKNPSPPMPHHLHVFRFTIKPFTMGHSQKCNGGIDYCLIIDPWLRVESPHPRAVPYTYSLSLRGNALTLLQTINNCVWYNLFCGLGYPTSWMHVLP